MTEQVESCKQEVGLDMSDAPETRHIHGIGAVGCKGSKLCTEIQHVYMQCITPYVLIGHDHITGISLKEKSD
jgi:hypothetical protein